MLIALQSARKCAAAAHAPFQVLAPMNDHSIQGRRQVLSHTVFLLTQPKPEHCLQINVKALMMQCGTVHTMQAKTAA